MSVQHRICDHPLYVHPDATRLAEIAAERVIAIGEDAIARHGAFHMALSGGTTPRQLYRALAQPERRARLDWRRVHLYFGDERAVPPEHPDSNFRMARETLIDHIPTPSAQVITPDNLNLLRAVRDLGRHPRWRRETSHRLPTRRLAGP